MKVLIVDDNRELAENIGELLEDEGHDVEVRDDAAGAEEAIHTGACAFDFALVDIRLAEGDGVALAERLRGACPTLRFALMTAFSDDGHLARAESLAIGPVLRKPVPMTQLFELLER